MLKIVHLITGAAALLLSFIPSLQTDAVPYLQHNDALYLAFLGLLNLTLAPVIPYWNKGPRHQLQNLVSALQVRYGVSLKARNEGQQQGSCARYQVNDFQHFN